MLPYCLRCRKNTESKCPRVVKAKNERTMLLSKCDACDKKKSKFTKKCCSSGLLSSLEIRTPLSRKLI